MPPYQFTRARDVAPHFFDQISRIQGVQQAHTQRFRALQDFARREAERKAREEQLRQLQVQAQQAQTQSQQVGFGFGQAPTNVRGNVALGRQLAAQRGWTGNQWNALYALGQRESGWRNTAQNPTSTAYGIGQFLNATWRTVGGRKTSDPAAQIEYMLRYISQRYGNPVNAMAFWNRNNWY